MTEINANLTEYIHSFKDKKVLVLGDLLLDEYIWGDTDRISPEAPVPVVNIKSREFRPGGAANVAMTIKALNGTPILAGVLGDDESASFFSDTILKNGIHNSILINESTRITPRKTRIVASNQQMLRIDHESLLPISDSIRDQLICKVVKELDNVHALLISDYAKGLIVRGLMAPLIDKAKSRGIFINVDPKPVNMRLYRGVSLISPNLKETSDFSGINITDKHSLKLAADKIMNDISPDSLLVTRGAQGLSLFTSDGNSFHLPAITSHVYDVSGAGDTTIGTLTLAMASGADIFTATKLSNYAAAIVVRKPGVASVTPDELISFLSSNIAWEDNIKPS